jgi:DNA (cytosine-5)-methyltransferase 1
MTAFGQYEDDDSASTLKQRDHKDATDLVVSPTVTSKWAKGSGGPAGSETGNLVTQPAWWDGGDTADSLTTTSDGQRMPDKQRLQAVIDAPEAKMLFVRNGVEVDRHGKKAGKGALIATEEAPTLDAGNHWALFQPQAYRKSRRPQSDQDAETWVDDGDANTLNTFDLGETRTTHAIVEPSTYGVRRLTPVECERLQAFPDRWTEPAVSDSARYKALGNAVTVNTVRWVLGRILEQS